MNLNGNRQAILSNPMNGEDAMNRMRWLLLSIVLLMVAGCAAPTAAPAGGAPAAAATEAPPAEEESAAAPADELVPVRLQLQWVTQSQFAGYYAALDQGFYAEEGLDVTILEGAVEIVPQQVVAADQAEFGIAWVPKVLASREQGADLVNIAQVFQRSGTLEISWADSGITTPADWAGKRVGTWGFGNEFELFAALRQAGIEPDDPSQVTIVQQPFDMALLLNREVDAAEAMIYNEYAQVLEAVNPDTGELYQPEDLSVIDFNDVGTAMLQDHVFAREAWLAEEGNEDIAVRFLRASFKGWIFCRDNFDACVEIVLANGPTLGEGHMRWQLNEINALIWPSPNGIGMLDDALYQQTVAISTEFAVLSAPPDEGAVRTDLAEQALAGLTDLDTTGEGFEKLVIEVTPGGE
jgi:NitT/TauT family transport system substrate-binding protein